MTVRRKTGINADAKGKPWKDLTEEEIDGNYNTQCSKCKYRGMIGRTRCCDYLIITGERRGCSALGCKRFELGGRTRAVIGIAVNNTRPTRLRVATGQGKKMKPSGTHLGKALEEYMRANHLNQLTLADRLGINRTTAIKWRTKPVRLTNESIGKIAGVLGVGEDTIRELAGRGMIDRPETGGEP